MGCLGLSFFNGWLDWNSFFYQKRYIEKFTVIIDDLKVFLFHDIPLKGPLENDVTRVWGGRGCPKVVTKSDIGGRGYMQKVTSTPKKVRISFYFSLVFGQRSRSWALVSIPVVVSFQALAWVRARRVNRSTNILYSNLVVSTQIHIK